MLVAGHAEVVAARGPESKNVSWLVDLARETYDRAGGTCPLTR